MIYYTIFQPPARYIFYENFSSFLFGKLHKMSCLHIATKFFDLEMSQSTAVGNIIFVKEEKVSSISQMRFPFLLKIVLGVLHMNDKSLKVSDNTWSAGMKLKRLEEE